LDRGSVDQRLGAARDLRDQGDGLLCVARGDQPIEEGALHSTASSQICSLPPQARPTSQACSLVMPKSRRRGLPPAITSRASCPTAPAMRRPGTEPPILPSPSTASWLPTGRGEDPHVATTVATATPRPPRRQAAACSRIFSLRASAAPAIGSLLPCTAGRVPRAPGPGRRGSPDYAPAFNPPSPPSL